MLGGILGSYIHTRSTIMHAGLILVAFTPNFWIALIGIVMCGLSATFGEK